MRERLIHNATITLLFVAALIGGLLGYAIWMQYRAVDALASEIAKLSVIPESNGGVLIVQALSKPITLNVNGKKIEIPQEITSAWVGKFYRSYTKREEYRIKSSEVLSLLKDMAPRFHVKPVSARFGINKIDKNLIEKVPSVSGHMLNIDESLKSVTKALSNGLSEANLVLEAIEPNLSLKSLSEMGITGMLASGSSDFAGSTDARITNIKVGASKYDQTFINPGDEFSFNDRLGEVTAAEGYVPGLVIKGFKLIPEYGGGLCQVSTTMFRVAAHSGLKITERRPHSQPVRFYNPQGFDSTIYPGVVDLKFVNDTTAPIMIQSSIKGTVITFEMYGAPDGRKTAINGPQILQSNPDGSLKTVLTRAVTYADGTTKKDQFYSNYKSPGLFEIVKNPLE